MNITSKEETHKKTNKINKAAQSDSHRAVLGKKTTKDNTAVILTPEK